MKTDYKFELSSKDRERILAALYRLSGDDRDMPLPSEVYDEAVRLVADDDEEIAWRAIIAFGLVRPTPSILNELIAAAMRWLHVEQFVGLAALDSIARLIGTNSLNQVEKNQAIAKVNQLEGVDSRWLIQFNRMAKGQVPYREFVASVGT